MNMFFRLTALAGLLAIAGQTFAVEDITRADQIPVLKEETQHATVSERVTSRFTRSHYRQFDLDQAFSAKIFDRYLNLLDYSHNVLLASDIEQYAKKKTVLGDELRTGKLDVFYDLYNLAQKRRFERYQYALSVLARPMDFTGNDTFNLGDLLSVCLPGKGREKKDKSDRYFRKSSHPYYLSILQYY